MRRCHARVPPHLSRVPNVVVEALRLCVVVFFAGLGYYVSQRFDDGQRVLGAFGVLGLGIVLGSALGYVLGGVLGRGTVGAVRRAEAGLRATSAEQIVAGGGGGGLRGIISARGTPAGVLVCK